MNSSFKVTGFSWYLKIGIKPAGTRGKISSQSRLDSLDLGIDMNSLNSVTTPKPEISIHTLNMLENISLQQPQPYSSILNTKIKVKNSQPKIMKYDINFERKIRVPQNFKIQNIETLKLEKSNNTEYFNPYKSFSARSKDTPSMMFGSGTQLFLLISLLKHK